MILILDQKKHFSRDGGFNLRRKEWAQTADASSFVAVKLADGSGYHILKNRNGKSRYTVRGELALNQLISENLKH